MADFTVVYKDWITLKTIISKVYAVDTQNFLILDGRKFKWVPIRECEPEWIQEAVSVKGT